MPRKGGVPENLRPAWKKGQSGNPKGSDTGPRLKTIAREIGDKISPQSVIAKLESYGLKVTDKRIVSVQMLALALRGISGDNIAAKEFNDRYDGRAVQPHSQAQDEQPLFPLDKLINTWKKIASTAEEKSDK